MHTTYREALTAQGLAPRTVYHYSLAIQRAETWFAKRGQSLDTATAVEISEYAATIPQSFATLNLTRAALTRYWDIIERPKPPIKAIRVPTKPIMVCKAIEEHDASLLAKAARSRGDRQGLAVAVGLYAAFRREEIALMRWEDISDGWVRLIGKGNKEAKLPLHPVLAELLDEAAPTPREGWVFPGRFDGHVCPATIWAWVLQVAEEAGVGHVPTHILRHIALATANDRTGDLRATQSFARHSKPQTTSGYTRTTARKLRAVVESLDY